MKLVGTLLLAQLLPLAIGLGVRQWRPLWAERLKKPANLLTTILNLVLLGLILVVQYETLIGIPLRAFAGMSLLVLAALAIGWLLGEPGGVKRKTLAITTAVRNAGVCLVIVSSSFAGTPAVTAATVYALFQTISLALIALSWGRLRLPIEGDRKSPQTPADPVPKGAVP